MSRTHFSSTFLLVRAAKGGEKIAFKALVERFYFVGQRWLERERSRLAKCGLDPGDVLGTVFEDLLTHTEKVENFEYRGAGSFRKYFYVVLRTTVLQEYQKHSREKRIQKVVESHENECKQPPGEDFNRLWRLNLVRRALADWMLENRRNPDGDAMCKLFSEIYLNRRKLAKGARILGIERERAYQMHRTGKEQLKEKILELIRFDSLSDKDFLEEMNLLFHAPADKKDSSCPEEIELGAYHERMLSTGKAKSIKKHIKGCAVCKARLKSVDLQNKDLSTDLSEAFSYHQG